MSSYEWIPVAEVNRFELVEQLKLNNVEPNQDNIERVIDTMQSQIDVEEMMVDAIQELAADSE